MKLTPRLCAVALFLLVGAGQGWSQGAEEKRYWTLGTVPLHVVMMHLKAFNMPASRTFSGTNATVSVFAGSALGLPQVPPQPAPEHEELVQMWDGSGVVEFEAKIDDKVVFSRSSMNVPTLRIDFAFDSTVFTHGTHTLRLRAKFRCDPQFIMEPLPPVIREKTLDVPIQIYNKAYFYGTRLNTLGGDEPRVMQNSEESCEFTKVVTEARNHESMLSSAPLYTTRSESSVLGALDEATFVLASTHGQSTGLNDSQSTHALQTEEGFMSWSEITAAAARSGSGIPPINLVLLYSCSAGVPASVAAFGVPFVDGAVAGSPDPIYFAYVPLQAGGGAATVPAAWLLSEVSSSNLSDHVALTLAFLDEGYSLEDSFGRASTDAPPRTPDPSNPGLATKAQFLVFGDLYSRFTHVYLPESLYKEQKTKYEAGAPNAFQAWCWIRSEQIGSGI